FAGTLGVAQVGMQWVCFAMMLAPTQPYACCPLMEPRLFLFVAFFPRETSPDIRKADSKSPSPSRSEEHTSELQSLRHLVCRLLRFPSPPFPLFPYTTLFRSFAGTLGVAQVGMQWVCFAMMLAPTQPYACCPLMEPRLFLFVAFFPRETSPDIRKADSKSPSPS